MGIRGSDRARPVPAVRTRACRFVAPEGVIS